MLCPSTINNARHLRTLYHRATGMRISLSGWFATFVEDALRRQEQYCRVNGIPLNVENPTDPKPFTGILPGEIDDSD